MEKTVYIYMIRPTICYEEGECYIGSTVKKLNIRFNEHKCHSKFEKWCSSKILFDKFTADFLEIIELRKCNQTNRKNIESHYIRKFKCVNKFIPNRKRKEYVLNNKEYKKSYYQNNKEKFNKNRKEFIKNNENYFKNYYEKNKEKLCERFECECGGKYTYYHKSTHFKSPKHKKYFENNNIILKNNNVIL